MLIKTKKEAMAYKQEKNPLRRDGASAVGAVVGISALLAKLATAGKAAAVAAKGAKLTAASAKAAKAAKLTTKAAQVGTKASKATKLTTKAGKLTAKAAKKTQQAAKLGDKAQKLGNFASKVNMPKLQTVPKTNFPQTSDKAVKVKDAISKSKDLAKKINSKVDNLATKASDFSKEVGLDRSPEEVKDIAKEKLLNTSSQLANRVEQTSPALMNEEEEKRQFDISKSSYSNPATISMGPSKSLKNINTIQDVGKKSAQQFGAEMRFNSLSQYGTSQEDDKKYDFRDLNRFKLPVYNNQTKKQEEEKSKPAGKNEDSLKESNLRPANLLKDFDAYASVGGIVFNVGDVARLGYAGVQKFIENKPKREKRRLDRKLKKGDKVENATFNFTKDKLKANVSKGAPTGENIVSKVAKIDRKDYLTKGIKPSYKK